MTLGIGIGLGGGGFPPSQATFTVTPLIEAINDAVEPTVAWNVQPSRLQYTIVASPEPPVPDKPNVAGGVLSYTINGGAEVPFMYGVKAVGSDPNVIANYTSFFLGTPSPQVKTGVSAGTLELVAFNRSAASGTITVLAAPVGITTVDYESFNITKGSGTTQTFTFATPPLADDYILVLVAADVTTGLATTMWSLGTYSSLYTVDGVAVPARAIRGKKMPGTPDTTIDFVRDSSRKRAVIVLKLRNVNTTTPVDVTIAASSGATAATTLASPAVTTVTNNAEVFSVLSISSVQGVSVVTPPTGYTYVTGQDVGDGPTDGAIIFVAKKTVAVAGTETPGVWTVDTACNMRAQTIAMRPV